MAGNYVNLMLLKRSPVVILVGTGASPLVALNTNDGTVRWQKNSADSPTNYPAFGTPELNSDETIMYFANTHERQSTIYARTTSNGDLLWESKAAKGRGRGRARGGR